MHRHESRLLVGGRSHRSGFPRYREGSAGWFGPTVGVGRVKLASPAGAGGRASGSLSEQRTLAPAGGHLSAGGGSMDHELSPG